MARVQTIVCDRCGAKDDNAHVLPWSGRHGSDKVTGELCDKCWTELKTLFRPRAQARTRHQIVITDPSRIQ